MFKKRNLDSFRRFMFQFYLMFWGYCFSFFSPSITGDVRETLFSLGQWLMKGILGLAVMTLVIVPLIQWMVSWFIKRHNANQSSVTSEIQGLSDPVFLNICTSFLYCLVRKYNLDL